MDVAKLLLTLITEGGPYAVASIAIVIWWLERQRANEERTRAAASEEALLELATAQVRTVTQTEGTLRNMEQTLHALLGQRN